jgi:hypothetical protein
VFLLPSPELQVLGKQGPLPVPPNTVLSPIVQEPITASVEVTFAVRVFNCKGRGNPRQEEHILPILHSHGGTPKRGLGL